MGKGDAARTGHPRRSGWAPPDYVISAVGNGEARNREAFLRSVGGVAAALRNAQTRAAIVACEDSFEFAVALLGCLTARCQPILPPHTKAQTLAALATQWSAAVIHGQDAERWSHVPIDAGPSMEALAARLPLRDSDAILLATGGTTGKSLWLPKTLGQLEAETAVLRDMFGLTSSSRVLLLVPPFHLYALLWGILLPLHLGGVVVRSAVRHPEAIAQAIEAHGVTHVVAAPPQLVALATLSGLPKITQAFSSAAPLPAAAFSRLAELGWGVTEIFGSTETGGIAFRAHPAAAWKPLRNVTISAEEGFLAVESPFLHPSMRTPFRTMDRVVISEGAFTFEGRIGDFAKAGGKRISLSAMEARVRDIPGVRSVVARTVASSPMRDAEVWLAVVGEGLEKSLIREALSAFFDEVLLPRRIAIVDALPETQTGKLPQDAFEALFRKEPLRWHVAPTNVEERSSNREESVLRLTFPITAKQAWFNGHFPRSAILPGVVQLQEFVVREAQRHWIDLGEPTEVRQLKFHRVVRPETSILSVLRRPSGRACIAFEIFEGEFLCASGIVAFGSAQ